MKKQVAYYGRWDPFREDVVDTIMRRTEDGRYIVFKVYSRMEPRPKGLTGDESDFESWDPAAARNNFNFVYDQSLKG